MKDEVKHEIQILLDLLKSSLTRNGVSMATDREGNLMFFDTNKYIKDRTFDGIKININDIVK
jgi:hypothetical protein